MSLDIVQQSALNKLSKLKAGALFMKMGTGKTKVALDLIKSRQNDFDKVIWLAPASLLRQDNYHSEISKWSKGLVRPIKFYTIESIGSSDVKFLRLCKDSKEEKSFCVIDESLLCKNGDAKRTARLLQMRDNFAFRLILNGTPVVKCLLDIYWQIEFISPLIFGMTEYQFAYNFLRYKNKGFKPWKRWSRPENEEALVEIIKPYIFDAELDISAQLYQHDIYCLLNDKELETYTEFKDDYLSFNHDIMEFRFLEVAKKFQHFYTNCCNKRDKLKELVSDIIARGEKVIIFCKFIDEVNEIKKLFIATIITGKEKGSIEDFQNHTDILICTYGVGSFGLNLQFANNVIFYSQTFNFGQKEQAIARVYRAGQSRACNIYDFWIDNVGLEKVFKKSLERKEETHDNINRLIGRMEVAEL